MTTETIEKISDEEVTRVIREVVKGREDYVYENPGTAGCVYTLNPNETDGIKGSCLVGCVLEVLDPDLLEELSYMEWNHEDEEGNLHATNSPSFSSVEAPRFSWKAQAALRAAQACQDVQVTWGDALATFEEEMSA